MASNDTPYQPAPPVWTQLRTSAEHAEGLVLPGKGIDVSSDGEISIRTEVEKTLEMWLQWNEVYQNLTEQMYEAKTNFHQLEIMADQLDELRLGAVEKTRKILATLRKIS
ncbi:MAG: hypothetical protein ACUVQG_11625 [Thermogutta sp.]